MLLRFCFKSTVPHRESPIQFSKPLSRIGKPCFDFQSPRPASGQLFLFFIGTFPRRDSRFYFSLALSCIGITVFSRKFTTFSFILCGFDEKSAQIHHILYDFCSSKCGNRRILCNFALAIRKERKDILLNRLSIHHPRKEQTCIIGSAPTRRRFPIYTCGLW